MINNIDGRRKCQNAISEAERKNYRNLRNLLKRNHRKANKEYFENIRGEVMEFPRTRYFYLM
jgi:hypothetical protein